MKKIYLLLLLTLCFGIPAFPQMYILNEDFSSAEGTTPPSGWNIEVISGSTEDSWRFDNPGSRLINYPATEPVAIFDSEFTSDNEQPESVSLQTPIFDASVSNFILLNFHHILDPGTGGSGRIDAFNGSAWTTVATFSSATANPASEILDLSAITGGVANARLRFVWSGNGSGFWALDNIRIYASQPLDGGMVSIDAPSSPVAPGVQNVEVTIGNFGYNTITTATIRWMANGITQTPFNWNGSAGFGQSVGGIVIGSYNFQTPVELKVWMSNPNGQPDPNPYNDTITKFLQIALCGTYTIGGANPDFETLTDAVAALNSAGVTCPVTFLIRDGLYYEQFILRTIPGSSPENTVTFRSESGDSTLAVVRIIPGALKYEPMIYLDGGSHVRFRDLGFTTGSSVSYSNNAVHAYGSQDIILENCRFEMRNQFDFGVAMLGGSNDIIIRNNRFESVSGRAGAVSISGNQTRNIIITGNNITGASEWGYSTITIDSYAGKVNITGNIIDRSYRAIQVIASDSVTIRNNVISDANYGVYTDNWSNDLEISGNRIIGIKSHQNVPDGTSGIFINRIVQVGIFNNFIHTTGDGITHGISLQSASSARVHYNSVNITNLDAQGRSKGIYLRESSGTTARNNIFHVKSTGAPVYLEATTLPIDFDRNNYFSFDQTIGFYNGVRYTDLASWSAATGTDATSLSVRPFYTSDTDLSMNQVLLNNAGIPVAGIDQDIDGTNRDPVNPDLGAKEYNLCAPDAGINALLSPQNPLAGGPEQVRVLLQNQGSGTLSSVKVNWQVNESTQTVFQWSGSLPAGTGEEVVIGTFDFQPGILYTLKLWTSEPNSASDCNHHNDTITTGQLAAPLCGTYTIGGAGPHFTSVSEAARVLNLAGVICPVTLLIRDGLYYEQFNLKEIQGSSEENTVTFRSESGDSTQAVIRIIPGAQKFETMIYLQGTQNVIFRELGLFTGSSVSFNNNAILLEGTRNITFEGCYFEVRKESDLGIGIQGGGSRIQVKNSRFESFSQRASAITMADDLTREVDIIGNTIKGATDWNFPTIKIGKDVRKVELSGNRFERCFRAIHVINSDSMVIRGNWFDDVNDGIYIDDGSNDVEISGNRMTRVKNHPDSPDGTNGIYINNTNQIDIFNNFIHTSGSGAVIGILLQKVTSARVNFNSVNITNQDFHAKSKGIIIRTSNTITARNNIFAVKHSGTPVYIAAYTPQLDLGHNNYYSFDQTVGYYNGNLYTDLNTWADSVVTDVNSLSANPFFTTETELSINQVLLNNAGVPIPGILTDIDGALRHPTTPDIGAREYTPCAIDAGINAVLSPESPLSGGTAQVRVRLQNHGTASLSAVKINWQVNEEVQAPFQWSGTLPSGMGTEVTAGSFDYQPGILYVVKVWTSEPNGQEDCDHANDTLMSRKLAGPLCGVYTIGGENPDFDNVSDAATVLNLAGITCPVTFVVRDGLYYEQLRLNDFDGSSPDRPVIFRSESGDNTQAVIRIAPVALKYESMIYLNGTRNITFQNLGLYTGSATGIANNAAVLEGASNITFDHCYFEVRKESDLAMTVQGGSKHVLVNNSVIECVDFRAGAASITGAGTYDVTFTGNTITGTANRQNVLLRVGSQAKNITISGNHISRCYRAIYIVGADSLTFSNNFVNDMHEGIYVDNSCSNIKILANRFLNVLSHQNSPDGTNGIFARNTINLDVINNFVHSRGDGPVNGIYLQGITSLRVHFNSVNNTNSDSQQKSNGIVLKNPTGISARNNIFSIKTSGTPFQIDGTYSGISLDYNDYFHPQGVVGKAGGQTYSSLSQWGQLLSGDANSKVVNPYFKADTIPLPFQRALNGAGIPVADILLDIDGKLRFGQAPDVGCFEFFVDYGVLELLSPSLDCYHPDVDSVIVYIRQYGDVPFNDLKVAYRLGNGAIHTDTIPGPLYEDVIHSFGTTENISTYGDYLFKIWLINTLDDNINNDTLNVMRYSKPPPVVSMSWDNFCTGWTVSFSGQASVVSPYFIQSYEWLFGDGETSTEQNPTHTFTGPGTYNVAFRAYSDAGCYSETISQVYIDPEFLGLSSNYNLVPETCLGDGTGSLEILAFGGYPPYSFYVNGNKTDGSFITGFPSGLHEIRIVDSENCVFIDSLESVPAIFLNPQIYAEPVTGTTPLTVQFLFTANDPATWTWYFTENDTSHAMTPSFTFTEFGNYQVILEVRSGHPHYCIETAVIEIFADIIVTIEANNVFTPNNDGHNDFFEVRTAGIREMKVNIFNQWGNKVYQIGEIDGKWDGNTKGGVKVPDGTYLYLVDAIGFNSRNYTHQGSVLLLRHAAEAYPNPARNQVKVKVHDPLEAPVYYNIYSLYGQPAGSGQVSDPENILIDLSRLTNGIYFLKIHDGRQHYFVRIIKN